VRWQFDVCLLKGELEERGTRRKCPREKKRRKRGGGPARRSSHTAPHGGGGGKCRYAENSFNAGWRPKDPRKVRKVLIKPKKGEKER